MDILFLGTSSGAPTNKRNVSGTALITGHERDWILVDCGEGTQHQILNTPLSLNTLSTICITHVHGDHCFGLFGLLASAGMGNRQTPLLIVAPAEIQQMVETVLRLSDSHLHYPIEWMDVSTLERPVEVAGVAISRHELSHRVPSYAYRFTELHISSALDVTKLHQDAIPQGKVWGKLQKGMDVVLPDGRTIAAVDYQLPRRAPRQVIIAGDNDTPDLLTDAAVGTHVLVHEATYNAEIGEGRGKMWRHSDAARVARFAEAAPIPNLVLMHFSARFGDDHSRRPNITDLAQEAQALYGGRLFMAQDLVRYHLGTDGVLQLAGV